LQRTVDRGATWSPVCGGPDAFKGVVGEPESIFEIPAPEPHAGRILAGAGDTSGISYSDDRGATWHLPDLSAFPVSPGNFVDFGAWAFRVLPSGRILASGQWGIATSDNSGTSWAPTSLFRPFGYETYGLAALATPGSVQTGAPACGLSDTTLCDGAVTIGIDATRPDTQVWRTNDGGRTWSAPVALPEPRDGLGAGYPAGVIPLGVEPNGLGRAVVITGRGLIYLTRDGGDSWTAVGRMPITLDYNRTRSVKLGPDGHLWVGTKNAGPDRAWMYRTAEPAEAAFAVAGEAGPQGASGMGVSVRPNPASGRAEVVVTLAEAGPVRVAVLDALGREVAVALDGAAGAGETDVAVETGAWPAGVYVVRVTVGAQTATARLVVTR
ncbi:MAG TPA: T9SS type A sorting domain-containing protein, partial [Rubricoccaceae bacterium]